MKFLILSLLFALSLADHPVPLTPGYASPVRTGQIVEIRTSSIESTETESTESAESGESITVPEVKVAKTAPVVRTVPFSGYAAPVVRTAPVSGYATPVVKSAPVPVSDYVAPVARTAPVSGYTAPVVKSAPVPVSGYAAPEVRSNILRTEEIRTPSQDIEYNLVWTSPVYQRLVKSYTYAPSEGYGAAVESPRSEYSAPRNEYSAPSVVEAVRSAPTSEYAAPIPVARTETSIGQAKAFIRMNQRVGGTYGTRTIDSDGNTVSETYEGSVPHYNYEYGIDNPLNQDMRHVQESSQGGQITGSYMFLQPDGCTRSVRYTSNVQTGFRAVVEYRGDACAEKYDL